MLTKILYSYYALASLTALVQKIVNLLSSTFPDDPMIAAILTRITPKLEVAVQAIGSTTKQPLTERVNAADATRDNSFRSLRDHIKAGLRRENETYRTACEALWIEFEKNGLQLFSFPREKETAGLDSLLSDLRQAKNEPHVITTRITKWMEELDNGNKAYVKATQERSAARSTDDTVGDEVAFKDLKASLDLLENVLNTLYAMNTPEGIAPVAEEVSQYIHEANTAAKLGKSKPDNSDDTQED